jgi:hypothetical protein
LTGPIFRATIRRNSGRDKKKKKRRFRTDREGSGGWVGEGGMDGWMKGEEGERKRERGREEGVRGRIDEQRTAKI